LRFETLELSIDLIYKLRQPVARLRTKDAELSSQIRAAASSVALNLAEGRKRTGKDRLHHWRIAAGSADEVRTALRVALAWGDLEEPDAAGALGLLDRVLAMLWRLTH
jgi:four helix bundle protein